MNNPPDHSLDFERPVRDLEKQIEELQEARAHSKSVDLSHEIQTLQKKVAILIEDIYSKLSPWERVQLSRHPRRPHALDYIDHMIDDFHELAGDRYFADDRSIVTGLGRLGEQKLAVIGIEKGRRTKDKVKRNFGMPRPEGYRKALRVMQLATRFHLPILTLVDTPGAHPGIGAEERGQSAAIAQNLTSMFGLETPIISLVIGEGGSGGALGIAIADRVCMMEFSIYSVISPESCASILWADPTKAKLAANALQLGPLKALELGVIDHIIPEPMGAAHRDPEGTYRGVKEFLIKEFKILNKISLKKLLHARFKKFRKMGNSTLDFTEKDKNPGQ